MHCACFLLITTLVVLWPKGCCLELKDFDINLCMAMARCSCKKHESASFLDIKHAKFVLFAALARQHESASSLLVDAKLVLSLACKKK